jgi:hypothetical protein
MNERAVARRTRKLNSMRLAEIRAVWLHRRRDVGTKSNGEMILNDRLRIKPVRARGRTRWNLFP